MAKTIRIVIEGTIELPDAAEVISFRDEGGLESDHIKFKGHIIRPNIGWLEYFNEAMMRKKYPNQSADMGWESINEEFHNKFFLFCDEEWNMDELKEEEAEEAGEDERE
jgi:hypothetical protein